MAVGIAPTLKETTVATLKDRIVALLRSTPGLTDREMTDRIFGAAAGQQATNQAARALAATGQLARRIRQDSKIGNYLTGAEGISTGRATVSDSTRSEILHEDEVLYFGASALAAIGNQTPRPTNIQHIIRAYYHNIAGGAPHRYRSWEHCYGFFQHNTRAGIASQKEYAALQLGFYLASWGMYRGSTFLLRYDYSVHLGVVDRLAAPHLSPLWEREFGTGDEDYKILPIVDSAIEAVRDAYMPFGIATDTLITKVLLGTLGCLPACDRYFIAGFKNAGFKYSRDDFVDRVLRFCRDNRDELLTEQARIKGSSGKHYPLMKLADMYFWQIGYDLGATTAGAIK
jgi:hypothetical protein